MNPNTQFTDDQLKDVFLRHTHRFEDPEGEHERMRELWQAVQVKTGVSVPAEATIGFNPMWALTGAVANLGIAPRSGNVTYTLGLTDIFSDEQISGMLAHELGHFVLHADKAPIDEHEFEADTWAASKGYAEALLSGNERMSAMMKALEGETVFAHTPGHSTDDIPARTVKLREFLESQKAQAASN